jgi:hypothetical protein
VWVRDHDPRSAAISNPLPLVLYLAHKHSSDFRESLISNTMAGGIAIAVPPSALCLGPPVAWQRRSDSQNVSDRSDGIG